MKISYVLQNIAMCESFFFNKIIMYFHIYDESECTTE